MDLESLAIELGQRIPEQLREFLSMHDGEFDDANDHLFGSGHGLSSAALIASDFKTLSDLAANGGSLNVEEPGWYVAVGPVRPSKWRTGWIPFWRYDCPWAIDVDPALGGIPGQIISVAWDNQEVRVEFDGLEHMLMELNRGLARGIRKLGDVLRP